MGNNGGHKVIETSPSTDEIATIFLGRKVMVKQFCSTIATMAVAVSIAGGINGTSWWSYLLAGGIGLGIGAA